MSTRLEPAGILVAFEGIDGAGKTTQAGLLEDWLRPTGIEVVRTKEPTNGPWGKRLRASASTGRLSPDEELHAFLEDRREHVAQLINPALDAGKIVIVDRYYFSTAAYQGARGQDPAELLRINEAFAPKPDLLVLLQIETPVAMERIRMRGELDNAFEREEDLKKSARIFDSLDAPYLLKLDGTRARQAIADDIAAAMRQLPALAQQLAAQA
ncbi:MAG TPA: dTMP kinase [Polyangia bacterium]|jgi:dTMP kinase|nr:dTMP kinase [Polyangia bacterium]